MNLPVILSASSKSSPALPLVEATLLDGLSGELANSASSRRAAEIRIGLGYTCVVLDNGCAGLAYTFRHSTGHGCSAMRDAGSLAGRPASELLRGLYSLDPIVAAVGLATLNALASAVPLEAAEADALDLLAFRPEDTVGMVGMFSPLIEPLRRSALALHIFEKEESLGAPLSEQEQPRLLPQCQIVLITATTVINHTLGALLELCRNAREVVLLGPSTPLVPVLLAARGVTILSGVQVVDANRLMQIISEGGGTRQFGSAVRKVSLRIR